MSLVHRTLRRTRPVGTLLAALVLVGGGARSASAQFTIDNLEVHLTARPGESLVRLIPVRSELDSVQQVRFVVKDWVRDSLGGNIMTDYASLASSCQDRLEVFPLSLQLGARATEYIRVTYAEPTAPDPGCWAIVLGETVRPPRPASSSGGASVTITTLIGVKVYVHRANAVADGSIVSAAVEEFWEPVQQQDAPLDSNFVRQVAVRFANTGTAHLRVKSTVEIRGENSQLVTTLSGPEAYMTPESFRDVLVRLPAFERGRYAAIVLLDYGAAEITATQVEFEVP